jgi:hypothetical protein
VGGCKTVLGITYRNQIPYLKIIIIKNIGKSDKHWDLVIPKMAVQLGEQVRQRIGGGYKNSFKDSVKH